MKKKMLCSTSFVLMLALSLTSCGTSFYRPFSQKETSQSLREETLIQLNEGNYESASESAKKLWDKEATNESASLYSIALASQAGVGLFDLIVKTIEGSATGGATNSASPAASSTGNSVFNSLDKLLPSFTSNQLSTLKKAIDILDAAPEKNASRILFQRCLTAAIYVIPTIKNLQTNITAMQSTLASLPSKLGTGSSGTTCSASTTAINAAATEVSTTITNLGQITTDFSTTMSIVGECFPSSEGKDTLNAISQQVTKLTTNADKGCSVPATQKIGTYTLPSCLNDTIAATGGNTAVAGDKVIAGCELFINCASGTCF